MSNSTTPSVTSYLGLGGNVGDVVANFKTAINLLQQVQGQSVVDVSPVYKTPPWGVVEQDWFHNACAKIETVLTPFDLLSLCKQIEVDLMREKTVRWGPRTIDLDILLYGDQTVTEDRLTIPHAMMRERAFVLKPLIDIAPDLTLEGKSIKHWLAQLDSSEIEEVALAPNWWQST